MSDEGEVRRDFSASVLVYSRTLSATELAARLPIEGTAWDRPESSARSGSGLERRPRSGIAFTSRLERGENEVEQVADVFALVGRGADQIAALLRESDDFWGCLSIRARTTGVLGGVTVTEEHVQFAARLGLRIDVEFAALD